jgi:hypothetical protein
MELDEINELVRRVIVEIQAGSGRAVVNMNGKLCPIGDLEGFDSLNAVEASCLLSDYLGNEIPSNIMLSANPERQLTINDITERLYQIINAEGG